MECDGICDIIASLAGAPRGFPIDAIGQAKTRLNTKIIHDWFDQRN